MDEGCCGERAERCEACRGDGAVLAPGECPECVSLGVVVRDGLGRECPDCEGSGRCDYQDCPDCGWLGVGFRLQGRLAG